MSGVCCEPSPQYTKAEEERKAKEEADMNREFTINGVKLKVKDMFPDCWNAKDFIAKLNLLEKTQGGKDLMDDSVKSIMDDDSEEEA